MKTVFDTNGNLVEVADDTPVISKASGHHLPDAAYDQYIVVRDVELAAVALDLDRAKIDAELAASDKEMARVGEDLLDTLIAKGVIAFTDLPKSSRDKITARKAKRAARP